MKLHEQGVLAKYNVEMLGAKYEVIKKAEDRSEFKAAAIKAGLEVPKSVFAYNIEEAKQAVGSIKDILSSQPPVETASNSTILMRECCKYATEKASGVWNTIAPYLGHPVTFTISLASTAFCTGRAVYAYCTIKRYDDQTEDREQEAKKAYAFWRNLAFASGTVAAASGYACLTNQPTNN